jgi:hypothetical protein
VRTHSNPLLVGTPVLKGFDDDPEAFRLRLLHGLLLRKYIEMNGLSAPTATSRSHEPDR